MRWHYYKAGENPTPDLCAICRLGVDARCHYRVPIEWHRALLRIHADVVMFRPAEITATSWSPGWYGPPLLGKNVVRGLIAAGYALQVRRGVGSAGSWYALTMAGRRWVLDTLPGAPETGTGAVRAGGSP